MTVVRLFILLFLPLFLLAACGGDTHETTQLPPQIQPGDAAQAVVRDINPSPRLSEPSSEQVQQAWPDGQLQEDGQGQVGVTVTPSNLNTHGATLEFDVAMDTHSVDLSMDLTQLATLSTDTGYTVSATVWNAPGGGHHVVGVLGFPASLDGVALLDDASQVTLTIRNVDAPERTFTWLLSQ